MIWSKFTHLLIINLLWVCQFTLTFVQSKGCIKFDNDFSKILFYKIRGVYSTGAMGAQAPAEIWQRVLGTVLKTALGVGNRWLEKNIKIRRLRA